jgi:hypothetical protein
MLENRQESILKDLEMLRSEVNGLASKLGVKLPEKVSLQDWAIPFIFWGPPMEDNRNPEGKEG